MSGRLFLSTSFANVVRTSEFCFFIFPLPFYIVVFSLSLSAFRQSSNHSQKVSKDLLAQLRKSTGYPILKCRQALVENANDIDKAKVWLADQAEREGWTRVEQLQQRKTSHGLIGVKSEKNFGVMVEVTKVYIP